MKRIHLISGLGADKKAFAGLGEFTKLTLNFVDWIPNSKDETLNAYATRIISVQEIGNEDIIIGLSFGGLVALEIAKHLNLEKIILISSFRDMKDLKPVFESLLKLGVHKLIPSLKLNSLNSIVSRMFNATSKEGIQVLNEMLYNTDVRLTKWSIQKIKESDFETRTRTQTKIFNLIGDADKMIKLWNNENTYTIKGGGHFMIFENAEEVTQILKEILKK